MIALEQLGVFVAQSGREAASDEVRELLELHLIDSVGAWIAGAATAEGRLLHRFREAMQNETPASLGLDLATRCALARLSEIDDIHLASMTTPGAIVIPGALTLAAALPAVTTNDVTAAMLAGYEAMIRLGRTIDGPTMLYRGIWPTYFTAPFGIAAVAARLLRLNGEATADALALALTLASPGVGHHNAATTSRWFAVGNAARNGLAAALASKEGFTSDRKLADGNFLSAVYGLTPDITALTDGLDECSALIDVSFKPWCAARQTMAATQALREIIDSGVAPAAIDEIKVAVLPPHRKMIDHGVVAGDRASHLTSLQYNMAASAVAPELTLALSPSSEPPPVVRAFMQRITVDSDESLLADYPRLWPARVDVIAGSKRHERLATHVPGDPARPFDGSQVREKFLRFTAPVLGRDKAAHLLSRCDDVLSRGELAPLVADIELTCRSAMPGSS
jgi:2-methylcitrate dehydratase PrpD